MALEQYLESVLVIVLYPEVIQKCGLRTLKPALYRA